MAGASTQAAPAATTSPVKTAASTYRATATTPTPVPAPTVNLTITSPAGTSAFPVILKPGADACAVLEEARAEGKLSSLSIDYSTVNSSLHSAYVRQINSYANGWTFKVNGVSPEGCSLSHPASNDQIIWRYE